jgi:hypothetical protein
MERWNFQLTITPSLPANRKKKARIRSDAGLRSIDDELAYFEAV